MKTVNAVKSIKIVVDPKQSKTADLYKITSIVLDADNHLRLQRGVDKRVSMLDLGGVAQEGLAKKILQEMTTIRFGTGRNVREWYNTSCNTANNLFKDDIMTNNSDIVTNLLQNAIKAATDKGDFQAVIDLSKQLLEMESKAATKKPVKPTPTPKVVSLVETASMQPVQSLVGHFFVYKNQRNSKNGTSNDFGYVYTKRPNHYSVNVVLQNGNVARKSVKDANAKSIQPVIAVHGDINVGDLVKYNGVSRAYANCYGRVTSIFLDAESAAVDMYKWTEEAFIHKGKRIVPIAVLNRLI